MRPPLWKVSVITCPEAEEAVTEFLGGFFQMQPTSYTDVGRKKTVVTVFCQQKPDWSLATRLSIRSELKRLKSFGLKVGQARLHLAKLAHENWAETWKRHFKPIAIGSRLLIEPSWTKARESQYPVTVRLNPGLSFGTGQHPTTCFCLKQIVSLRRKNTSQSFLDLGTGSGILAITAAKLGYSPVHAVDCDPEALRSLRFNTRLNSVSGLISAEESNIAMLPTQVSHRYSLICANLVADLLIKQSKRILARLRPDGLLVMAGILKREFSAVSGHYRGQGLRLISSHNQREWRSGSFSWRNHQVG